MAFIELSPDKAATDKTAAIYAEAREEMGYVPKFARAFAARPDVYRAGSR